MCLRILASVLLCASASAFAQPSSTTELSGSLLDNIPFGVLAGNSYSNDTLGVVYSFPNGWSTTLDPNVPRLFDPDPKAVANQCTRILLRIEASGTSEVGFSPWGVFFVIDPRCLPAGIFPRSDTDKDALKVFVERISECFKSSPFISPDGSVFYGARTGGSSGPVIVSILGRVVIKPGKEGSIAAPMTVNTLFAVTESQGYWVGWAAVADDPAKEDLTRNGRILIRQNEASAPRHRLFSKP